MAKTKTITVTAEDIRDGIVGDGDDCPIAHAAKRAFRIECATCGDDVLEVGYDSFPLPKRACEFIERFDARKPVKPFSFRVKL